MRRGTYLYVRSATMIGRYDEAFLFPHLRTQVTVVHGYIPLIIYEYRVPSKSRNTQSLLGTLDIKKAVGCNMVCIHLNLGAYNLTEA